MCVLYRLDAYAGYKISSQLAGPTVERGGGGYSSRARGKLPRVTTVLASTFYAMVSFFVLSMIGISCLRGLNIYIIGFDAFDS